MFVVWNSRELIKQYAQLIDRVNQELMIIMYDVDDINVKDVVYVWDII
jgi:GGDEF domain-containing protein